MHSSTRKCDCTFIFIVRRKYLCAYSPQELCFNCRSTLVAVQYKKQASEYTAGMFVSTDRRSRQAIGISGCYWRAECQYVAGGRYVNMLLESGIAVTRGRNINMLL